MPAYIQSQQQAPLNQTPQTIFLLDGIKDNIVRQNFETLAKELAKRGNDSKAKVAQANIKFGVGIAPDGWTDGDGLADEKQPGGFTVEIPTRGNPVLVGVFPFPFGGTSFTSAFQIENDKSGLARILCGWRRNNVLITSSVVGARANNLAQIRGQAVWTGAAITVGSGTGWSIAQVATGIYDITFTTLFADVPSFVATLAGFTAASSVQYTFLSTNGVRVNLYNPNTALFVDGSFSFLATASIQAGPGGGLGEWLPLPAFLIYDIVPAGTYQYQFWYSKNTAGTFVSYENLQVVAYEVG